MARTVRTKVYKFEELKPKAQKIAIDRCKQFNVNDDWWDFAYDNFKAICKTIGVEVDVKKTYFSGFSHQGQGASFTADVEIFKLIDGITDRKYLEHAPKIHDEVKSLVLRPCPVDVRVLDLIKREWIDITLDIKANGRYYRTIVDFRSNYTYNECVNYKNIDKQLADLEEWITNIIQELDNLLYRLLEKEYEYQTSDEVVKETIIANEYEFTQDGKIFNS